MKKQVKYVFITGGVVSSLGKGITSASLALLLKSRGYRVFMQKLDPYLNVDPGTMSPYQHGEVFVTDDGAETDLDLGHYERFAGVTCSKASNYTSGRIYSAVLARERAGGYLGGTVQVVPHITDEIKSAIHSAGEPHGDEPAPDIVLCEIGGVSGDIESLPFLEAARQLPAQGADPAEYYACQPDRSEGEGLLYIEDLGDLWQGACAADDYRPESCVITGFPELGSALYPTSATGPAALGMSSSSVHKAECWAFLRQFYLHPMAYGFSGLQGSLEEEIQRQLQQRDRDGLTDRWPHAEEDMRLFAAAFTGSVVLARQDDTVRDIVHAEAAPFFAGERSAEDCAARIQERVKIYLSEQCP